MCITMTWENNSTFQEYVMVQLNLLKCKTEIVPMLDLLSKCRECSNTHCKSDFITCCPFVFHNLEQPISYALLSGLKNWFTVDIHI